MNAEVPKENSMPTNEEGEFELVLGNKQLLSVFFLVVLLLAVFFSMGYLAGRYTAPSPQMMASNRPLTVDPVTPQNPLVDPTKPSPSLPPTEDVVKPDPPKQTAAAKPAVPLR